jgi:mono/diheme cytochrome c family protein
MNTSIKLRVLLPALFMGLAFLLQEFPGVSEQEKSNTLDPLVVSSEQRAHSKKTFKDQCSRCHGSDGKGDTVLGDILFPPDFTDAKWWKELSNERLIQSLTNGKNEMPAFGKKLTKPEILALIAYVRCFEKPPTLDEGKTACD